MTCSLYRLDSYKIDNILLTVYKGESGEGFANLLHTFRGTGDAHIKSFSLILKREVIRRFEFFSFKDAENTISRFITFYNNERLHSAIDYRTPGEVYEKWKENIIEGSA